MRAKNIHKTNKEYLEKMSLLWWASLSEAQQADFLVKRIRNAKVFKQFLADEEIRGITPLFELQENGIFKYNKKAI